VDKKKKEWIKKNWISILLHILPCCIYIITIFTMLDIYSILLDSNNMLMNIFASVMVFGSLIFITTAMIYITIWGEGFRRYQEDYEKFIGE